MKFTPVPSESLKLVAHENVATDTIGYQIKLSIVGDPKTGLTHLVIGIGSNQRTQRAQLTREQAKQLTQRLQSLTTMM